MMQELNPGAGVWWANMPLPPGWGAKYDHKARKYFFMHHATRTTQWVDPRRAYYEGQRGGGIAPAPTAAPQRSPVMPVQTRPAIPMQPIVKPKCQTCKNNEVAAANQDCQNCQMKARIREEELIRSRKEAADAEMRRREERRIQSDAQKQTPAHTDFQETTFSTDSQELTETEKKTLIDNLDEAFPGVHRTVVEMILETSSWDTEKASSVLCTMSPQKPAQPKPQISAQPKPSAAAAAASKPAASKLAVSLPKKPTATNTVSEADRKRIKATVAKMFPVASDTLVEMALETTNYNQPRAAQLLRMTLASDKTKNTAAKTSTTSTKSQATSKGSASTVSSTTASSTGQSTTIFSSGPPKTSTPTPVASTTSTTSPASSTIPTKTVSSPSPAYQRPAKGMSLDDVLKDNQTFRANFEDAHSSRMNCGPDASLVSGSNVEHLLDNYVSTKGSDETNYRGPMKENVVGSSGSLGHDPSLVTGPQRSHYKGSHPNLAKGSIYKTVHQV